MENGIHVHCSEYEPSIADDHMFTYRMIRHVLHPVSRVFLLYLVWCDLQLKATAVFVSLGIPVCGPYMRMTLKV